jgi:hypothetical protein
MASTHALVLTLALVTPVGMALYSLQPDKSLLLSRNLSASLPAIALIVGSAICSLPRRYEIAAVALLFAALVAGTAKTFDPDYGRPAYREAAHLIDARATAGDVVIQPLLDGAESAGNPTLPPHFRKPHSLFMTSEPVDADAAAAIELQATVASRVFIVAATEIAHTSRYWQALLPTRFRPAGRRDFAGVIPLTTFVFSNTADRELRLVSRPGPDLLAGEGRRPLRVAAPGSRAGAGAIDSETERNGVLEINGWAVDETTRRPAETVFAFRDGRATGVAVPAAFRPDIAAIYGESAGPSGFSLAAAVPDTAASSPPRVIAISRGRAWELPRS